MFGFIKSIGGMIFGGGEHAEKKLNMVDKAVFGVGEWIDNKTYTEEEKAKDLSAAARLHLDLIRATADENGARSITRRVLAWAVTGFVCTWASVAAGFAIAGKQDIVDAIIEVSKTFWMGEAFVSVIVFYFGVQFFRAQKKNPAQ